MDRRKNPPPGYTTREMAADYARALGELGPSHLVGLSTGGLISQHLALDHPELVQRLVLVVTACRLSEEGRRICERWHALARQRRWPELRADMAATMVTGETNKRLTSALVKPFGKYVLGAPANPLDFLTMLDADLAHDTTEQLTELTAPTLLIGGSEDPFFPPTLLRETAAKITGAKLRIYGGTGHGAPKQRKSRFEDDALAFLTTRSTPA